MPKARDPSEAKKSAATDHVTLIPMPAEGPAALPESWLGKRIKYARVQLGLNIEALSRATASHDADGKGVSATSISRYESGENLPGSVELRILCDTLDVPADWLLFGDIPNAGKTSAEQGLIEAMRTFVAVSAAEQVVATFDVKPHLQWVLKGTREQILAQARLPIPRKGNA